MKKAGGPIEPVSVGAMAERLGYRDPKNGGRQRLMREISEREKETGERILTRIASSDGRSHFRVNERSMRRFFPEKFRRSQEDFAADVRAYGRAIEDRISAENQRDRKELHEQAADLQAGLLELASAVGKLQKSSESLQKQVARLMDAARIGPENC